MTVTNTELARQLPQIPAELLENLDDPNVRALLEPIIEWLQIAQGSTGNTLDWVVTRRDLWQAGVIDIEEDDGNALTYSGVPDAPGMAQGDVSVTAENITAGIPVTPSGLTTRGTEEHVMLFWDSPEYIGHAETQVWRASSNSLAAASSIATVPLDTRAYADDLGSSGITRYYWVRHVNIDGVVGNYNGGEAEGTAGTTTATPSTTVGYAAFDGADIVHARMVSAYIADAAITNAKIANATIEGGKIAASTITADKYSELRNSLIINGEDSVDATYPIVVNFPVLNEMTSIEAVRLSFSIEPFRAYSQAGSASAGGENITTDLTTLPDIASHTHNMQVVSDASTANQVGIFWFAVSELFTCSGGSNISVASQTAESHSHNWDIPAGAGATAVRFHQASGRFYASTGANQTVTLEDSNGHNHEFTVYDGTSGELLYYDTSSARLEVRVGAGGNVATTISQVDHDHDLATSNHTHNVNFGIYEEDNTGSASIGVEARNSNSGAFTTLKNSPFAADQLEIDVIDSGDADIITTSGWKTLKFTSNVRARIVWLLELKIDLTA